MWILEPTDCFVLKRMAFAVFYVGREKLKLSARNLLLHKTGSNRFCNPVYDICSEFSILINDDGKLIGIPSIKDGLFLWQLPCISGLILRVTACAGRVKFAYRKFDCHITLHAPGSTSRPPGDCKRDGAKLSISPRGGVRQKARGQSLLGTENPQHIPPHRTCWPFYC